MHFTYYSKNIKCEKLWPYDTNGQRIHDIYKTGYFMDINYNVIPTLYSSLVYPSSKFTYCRYPYKYIR
jgi:hypothetical protein